MSTSIRLSELLSHLTEISADRPDKLKESKECLTTTGYYLVRARSLTEIVKNALINIKDLLPLVENGAVPAIKSSYLTISSLSGHLSNSVKQFDDETEEENHCSPILDRLFSTIGQFASLVPIIASSAADSLFSQIESMKETINSSISVTDELLERFRSILSSINVEIDDPLSFALSNMLESIDKAVFALTVHLKIETFAQAKELIEKWMEKLTQLGVEIFSLASTQPKNAIPLISSVLIEKPSLFDVFEQCTDLVPFDPNVFSPLQAACRLYGNMLVIEAMEHQNTVCECISGIGDAYKSKSLLQYTRKADDLLTVVKLRQVVPNEVFTGLDAIRKVPGREAQYVLAVAKAFAASFGDFALTKSAVECVFKEIVVILNLLLNELKASAQTILQFIVGNLVFLNEKDAARANSYTARILDTKEYVLDDNVVSLVLGTFFASGSLTSAIKKLTSTEETVSETLEKLAASHAKVSSKFSAWIVEMLISISMQASLFVQISTQSTEIETLPISADVSGIIGVLKEKKCPFNISFDTRTKNTVSYLLSLTQEDVGAAICACLFEAMSFADGAFGYFSPLAYSHSLVNTACAIAEAHNRFTQYISSLRTVVEYSARMPSAVPSYRKTLEEASIASCSLPQPELAIQLPESVQRIRKLESISIQNKKLKEYGEELISSCRRNLSDTHISFTEAWFNAATSSLSTAEIPYDVKQEDLINKAAQILVSAVLKDDPSWDTIFNDAFDKTKSFLDTKEPKEDQIRDLTSSLYSLSLIHDPFILSTSSILSDALSEIQGIRSDDYELRKMRALFVMSRKAAAERLRDDLTEKTASIIADLKEGKIDSFVSSQAEFLDNFKKYCKDPTEEIKALEDQEVLLDNIYESVAEFRETMNSMLKHCRAGLGKGQELDDLFRKASSLAYKTTLTAIHSLSLRGDAEFKNVVEAQIIITPAFVSALNIALEMCETEHTQEDLIPYRRQSRYAVKHLDSFISLLESKQNEEKDECEYRKAKNVLANSIAELISHVLRIHSRATEARISEQFEEEKGKLLDTLSEKYETFRNNSESLLKLSVGETVEPFNECALKMNEKFTALQQSIENIVYGTSIVSIQLSSTVCEFSKSIQNLYDAFLKLSNEIIIKPDPESAAALPDEFPLTTLPDSVELESGLASLKSLQNDVLTVMSKLKDQFNAPSASNEEILVTVKDLTDVCQKFSSMAARVAVSTKDTHLQVQQQANIHSFANTIANLYESIRAMMMRVDGFEVDFMESITSIEKSMNTSVEYAVSAAKIVPVVSEIEQDEVSAELLATSRAIEEMSAKLKQFEGALGGSTSVEEIEIVDDEAEDIPETEVSNEELSTFVIRMSSPILQAAALILKRAQTITTQLIKQLGHIQNERLLIGSAQDLTEAAGLLLACAEMLMDGQDQLPEFQVIAAARIVKANISSLVAQVLVQGGDPEGIMNKYVKAARLYSDKIVKKAMSIVEERAAAEALSSPRKTTGNKMVQKLNMQTHINDLRKQMENDERTLYQFRRSNH